MRLKSQNQMKLAWKKVAAIIPACVNKQSLFLRMLTEIGKYNY